MDEKELVYQLKKDSQEAFNRIYNIYSAKLYAYCMQYVKSREDSEEIVQDVFIKLWIYRHTIIHEESIGAFIFKIAKNQLINRYKARLNSFIFEEYVLHYNEEQCSTSNTTDRIEYDDFCKLLKNAMGNLSNTQKKVVECVKLNQLSIKETAEKLKLKEQTVKNALSAGLTLLKETLKKHLILFLLVVLK